MLEPEIPLDISNYSANDWCGSDSLIIVDNFVADEEAEAVWIHGKDICSAEEVRKRLGVVILVGFQAIDGSRGCSESLQRISSV